MHLYYIPELVEYFLYSPPPLPEYGGLEGEEYIPEEEGVEEVEYPDVEFLRYTTVRPTYILAMQDLALSTRSPSSEGTAPIEIIYISDDDEMNVDDAGAAIPLGEPKQEDPEEEDPDEIEFYEDGEYEYYPTRLEGA
ncbi:hypothetical protein GUJ93_ZPchr0004g38221 [Zizania palustris]|uniref:Uncharacterized protein n=1 Tax=Zizania palustris TaxID=103762 RepID=A0A8J5SIP2_ZIZPA|nr:hypothetical protein GUJ93_ZPchr0004g38221 [Zizania palustris]